MQINVQIEEAFYRSYTPLDESLLLKINNYNTTSLHSVIVGLEKQCFGIMLMDDTVEIVYRLFYANGEKELQGDLLELKISDSNRHHLLFYFSQFLSHNYICLDVIDTYNTFQDHTRKMLEIIGFQTITPKEIEPFADYDTNIITHNSRGIICCPYIDKVGFYRNLLRYKAKLDNNSPSDYVYLMVNQRNGLIKIGRSQKPKFRERTLQSQEPEVQIIGCWSAAFKIERQLHTQFKEKRIRGEWFRLSLSDIRKIAECMEQQITQESR